MTSFDNYDREKLYKLIFLGVVNAKKLPKNLWKKTFSVFFKAMQENIDYNFVDKKLVTELSKNVYLFSGAKTEVQINEMIGRLVDGDKVLTFNEFRKKADEVFDTFNVNYLRAEYNCAVGQSQMVSSWADIYSNTTQFPYLRYDAVDDARTSDICRPLDGITLKFDDPFWSKYSPLNHFNCRCRIEKLSIFDEPELSKKETVLTKTKDAKISDEFLINPYREKVIFSKKHPYFQESKEYKNQL